MSVFNPGTKVPSPLLQLLMKHRPLYGRALFYSLIVNMLVLAPTVFMLEVYDRVVNSRNSTTLWMLLLVVIGAYVVMELLDLVRARIMHEVSLQLDAALRAKLFDSLFSLRLRGQQGVSTQAFADLRTLRDFLSSPAVMAMMDGPSSLVFIVLVWIINPVLGAMTLVGALVQVLIAVRTEKRTLPQLMEANRASLSAQAYARGTLRNAQVIEAMGMQGDLHARWAKVQRRFLLLQADASEHNATTTSVSKMIQMLQGSLILGVSCWLTLKGSLLGGGGMMIVASMLGARVLTPITTLVAQWRLVVAARDAFGRIDSLLIAMPDVQPSMALPAPRGVLTVEQVTNAAPGSQTPILRGVSFGVQPGELVAVIGPSAAGKSTLARLLVGIWPAASGKVRLDGVDIFAWNKDELGPHVGYLPQGVELFDGSLAANISRFGDIDMEKVLAAAALADLMPLVNSLPEGFETRIGDEGAVLSGGQRQRVALARALYGNPQLVVLDEPNASLDEAGEAALMTALEQIKARGATTVVITHRPSLLPVADKLVVLRDGQVAAFGPRADVLAAMQKAAAAAVAPAPRQGVPALAGGAA